MIRAYRKLQLLRRGGNRGERCQSEKTNREPRETKGE
jgi:hypothetical protein